MVKKIGFYLAGLIIACLGVCLILKSGIGAGPWDAFVVGLSDKLGITVGTAVMIMQAFYLLLNSFLTKKRIQFEAIVTILLWGFVTDMYLEVVLKNFSVSGQGSTVQWVVFLVGILVVGIGAGTYLTSKLPTMPYDGTMMAISERFNWKINIARTFLELIGIISAFLVGGPIGLGTVIILLLIGPLIQVCSQYSNRVFESF